jgi:DNA-binding CsgD family transcriptional regulator/tetratricopeptide (TPR) repeat protein
MGSFRLGWIAYQEGDFTALSEIAAKAERLARATGDSWLLSRALGTAGIAHESRSDHAAAVAAHEESAEIERRAGNVLSHAIILQNLANSLIANGDLERAEEVLAEAEPVITQQAGGSLHCSFLHTRAVLALPQGDVPAAEDRTLEMMSLMAHKGEDASPVLVAYGLEGLAIAAGSKGEHDRALRLAAAAAASRARLGTQASHFWAALRDEATATSRRLSTDAERVWSEGGRWTEQRAIAFALESGSGDVTDSTSVRQLSDREFEVVRLVVQARTSRQIAAELGLSVRTVESHVTHIRRKLDLPSRTAVASWGAKHLDAGPAEGT